MRCTLERPKSTGAIARGLSAEEVRRLLAVVPDTVAGRRDWALLSFFVLTGRRRRRVIGLTAGDISVEGDTAARLTPAPASAHVEVGLHTLLVVGFDVAKQDVVTSLERDIERGRGTAMSSMRRPG